MTTAPHGADFLSLLRSSYCLWCTLTEAPQDCSNLVSHWITCTHVYPHILSRNICPSRPFCVPWQIIVMLQVRLFIVDRRYESRTLEGIDPEDARPSSEGVERFHSSWEGSCTCRLHTVEPKANLIYGTRRSQSEQSHACISQLLH